jgi:PRTRC genetic system protein A
MKGIVMLDKRDAALQTLTPSVMVPKFGSLEPMSQSGQRYLLASDGLWVEVKRPWLDLVVPLAKQTVMPMPYGNLKQKMQFNFGTLPTSFLRKFINEARAHLPNECAAWFIWDEETELMRFEMLGADHASSVEIDYLCPILTEGEHVVADIHSHGTASASYSLQDNFDDRTEVKLVIVVGNVDTDTPSIKMRLCANGYFADLPCEGLGKIGGYDA